MSGDVPSRLSDGTQATGAATDDEGSGRWRPGATPSFHPKITRLLIEEVAKRPTADAGDHPWIGMLTERETEVLRLVARGRSNVEIAAELYLGAATINTHVGRVLAKLGARDRVQAVVMAFDSGLVEPGLA